MEKKIKVAAVGDNSVLAGKRLIPVSLETMHMGN